MEDRTWLPEYFQNRALLMLMPTRTPSTSYDEAYTVEYQNGDWIVTKNDL
jgi:hypothetical protein